LKTAAAGAAAAGIAGTMRGRLLRDLFPPAIAQEPKPINSAIVIGSGFGGLTAAMLLAEMGKQVTVIEKCHRPGGRCQVYTYPNGQHATVAFMEWYDMDEDMWWLVNELGYAKKDYYIWPDATFYNWRDQYNYNTNWTKLINSLPWDDPGGADDELAYEDWCWKNRGQIAEPVDLPPSNYDTFDHTDFETWMLDNYRNDVTEFWGINMGGEFGTAINLQSAGAGVWYSDYWNNDYCYALKDGNYGFIERMVSRLPAGSLVLNKEISSVENTATGVEVTAKGQKYTADVAIVSVDHTAVANIVPELPSERVAALAEQGSSKSYVALQQYSERFWKTVHGMEGWGGYSDMGINHTLTPGNLTTDDETSNQTGTTGILSQYLNEPFSLDYWSSPKGIHPSKRTASQVTDTVLDDMETFWPDARDYLIEGSERVYAWEPYTAMFPPRYVLDGKYAANRIPIGNIYFAAAYIYNAGASSAVLAARDTVSNFT